MPEVPLALAGQTAVFVGLAILASEFYWASRTLDFTRRHYFRAMDWFRGQSWWVRLAATLLTAALVVFTLWMLGALAWSARLVGLYHPALDSPLAQAA